MICNAKHPDAPETTCGRECLPDAGGNSGLRYFPHPGPCGEWTVNWQARSERLTVELDGARKALAAQREHSEELRVVAARAMEATRRLRDERSGEVWLWQGDGKDDPASLSCPVLMTADQVRALTAARDDARTLTAEVSQGVTHLPHADGEPCVRCERDALRDELRTTVNDDAALLARVASVVAAARAAPSACEVRVPPCGWCWRCRLRAALDAFDKETTP